MTSGDGTLSPADGIIKTLRETTRLDSPYHDTTPQLCVALGGRVYEPVAGEGVPSSRTAVQ